MECVVRNTFGDAWLEMLLYEPQAILGGHLWGMRGQCPRCVIFISSYQQMEWAQCFDKQSTQWDSGKLSASVPCAWQEVVAGGDRSLPK